MERSTWKFNQWEKWVTKPEILQGIIPSQVEN
jgi:hypothetical protein